MSPTTCPYTSFVTTRARAIIAPPCSFPKLRTDHYKVTKLAPLTTNPDPKTGPVTPDPTPTDNDKVFPFHAAYWCIIT